MSKITASLAGSRRFWGVLLFFAIANAGVWVGYDRWQKSHRHHLLEVRQFTPGDGTVVQGRPTLCWTFNLDVAPAKAGGPPQGSITPAIAGKWQWEDPRTLTFVPDGVLPRATRITVALNADALRTPDGFRLEKSYVTSLSTQGLEVIASRQIEFDDADRVLLEFTFNDKVLPAALHKHLTVRGGNGRPIPFHPMGEMAGNTVRVITDPMTALMNKEGTTTLYVQVSRGLAGESGPLGMAADYQERVAVAPDLLATGAEAYFPSHDEPFIQIRFNNPVREEALLPLLSVVPAVPFTVVVGDRGVDLHGPFQPSTHYMVKLAKPPAGASSKHLPRPTSLAVLIPDREAGLWFESEAGYLSAEGNRTVLAHAVNHSELVATVTRVYDNNLVGWRNAGGRRGYWRDIESFSRPLALRNIHLPTRKNEKQDIRLSLDDLLPAGEARDGVYQISLRSNDADSQWSSRNRMVYHVPADNDDEFDDGDYRYGGVSTVVTLSDIALCAKLAPGGVTVWATSLRTAQPLPGIHVRLFSNKSQLLGEATTEETGLASIVPLLAGPGEKPAVLIAEQQVAVEVHDDAKDGDGKDAGATAGDSRKAAEHQAAAQRQSPGRSLTWLDLRDSTVSFGDSDTAGRPYLRSGYEAFVYTDRGVYRPGETVHLRAIVRGPDNAMPQRFPVRWQIRRPDLHDWKAQMAEIDADGATSLDMTLPADLPSGRWTAHVGLPGDAGMSARFFGSVAFDVEDFMPQRMKVSVDIDGAPIAGTKGTGKQGDRLKLTDAPIAAYVQADYLFGRPVAQRPATMVVRVDPIPFQPAGYRDWTFGDASNITEAQGHSRPLGRRMELAAADLDAKGHAKWDVDVSELIDKGEIEDAVASGDAQPAAGHIRGRRVHKHAKDPSADAPSDYAGPWRLSVTGSVIEAGGRAITASRQIDLDRIGYYVGVKPRDSSPRPRVASTFDVQLVTPGGVIAAKDANIEFSLFRETWNSSYIYEHSHYRFQSTRILEPIGKGPAEASITGGRGALSVTPPAGGSYVLVIRDPQTQFMTSFGFYAGYGAWEDNISRENPEKLDLAIQPSPDDGMIDAALAAINTGDLPALLDLADRSAIMPPSDGKLHIGQSAQVIVRSPFAGQLLLSVENDGIISTQVLKMPANHIAAKIDITDACRPNAYVTATVVRAIDPNAAWTIHRAIGSARLVVDNDDRKLTVQVAAPAEIRPEMSLAAQIRVTDSAGNPVGNAAVTVAAVDEGICRLTDFQTPDPFAFFMAHRALAVRNADVFGQLMPETAKPEKTSAVGGDDDSAFSLKRGSPVGARRVKPVALVSAVLHTDAQGLARADFPTPQFTGQLRVMAVASADRSVGSADAPVLVRSPLLVQSSWPRFAAPGDRFSVPLTVFNNSTVDGSANITVEVPDSSPLRFASNNGTKLSLPALALSGGGQKIAAFDVIAQDRIGVAAIRLVATMNGETYEESVELPIRPASPTVTAGEYLVAKPDAPATVEIPAGFVDGTVKYELRVCNTPQLQLPQGLDYLDHYPYGCLEQTTSTLFPLVYLNDVGNQISPGLFDSTHVTDKVRVGMLRLMSMQTSDGGLAMWPGGREDWEWGSVYAAHFLVEAQAAGYEVPEELRDQLMTYVRALLNKPEETPGMIELQAYAAYVTALAGRPQRPVMERLSEAVTMIDAGSARFHLAAAWLAAGRRDLAAGLIPAALPAPRTGRELSGNIGSGIRDRAILISTLLAIDPDDPRIGALAQQLADAGRKGQWRSTQDTAFAVMAIGRYLHHIKGQEKYQTAEVLLDGQRIALSESGKPLIWTAASLDEQMSHELAPGAAKLPPAGTKLQVRITGPASARANIAWLETGVRTTPPASIDSGMTIRRRYLDEQGKPLQAMRVRSGDLVQVELTIQSGVPLDLLVIEDLLPAGLEIENPRLAGNADGLAVKPAAIRRSGGDDDAPRPAFKAIRSDRRDDRLILVGNLNVAGSGTYLYTARAVTPGHYVLPPVKGECMYDSGINSLFGAGAFEVLASGGTKVAQVGE